MCAIILVSVSLLFAAQQLPANQAKGNVQSSVSSSTPDNWQKMKDCAAQAEKAMMYRDRETVSLRGTGADSWQDHYSPKYNRCFISALYMDWKPAKGGPLSRTVLIDAFELSTLASFADQTALTAELACRNEENPTLCKQIAGDLWKQACQIGEEPVDCAKAKQFVKEHMKN